MTQTPAHTHEWPGQCPCCGAYSLVPPAGASILLAVCDVLVTKALEALGRYVVRFDRSRWAALGDRPKYIAHTLWPPTDDMVTKAIREAWDVVPVLLNVHAPEGWPGSVSADRVGQELDSYVHDLAITGEQHTLEALAERLSVRLGLHTAQHPSTEVTP